jgi:hypothetical protein
MLAIEQYRELELQLAQKYTYLEALKQDPQLQKEIAFDVALDDFLAQHSMNKVKLQLFLKADITSDFYKKPVASKTKATRATGPEDAKTFLNPHTGDVLTIKRLSHGTYKLWVETYGEDVVQSWLQA